MYGIESAFPATLTSLAYWFAVIVTSASVTVVGTLNVYFKPFEIGVVFTVSLTFTLSSDKSSDAPFNNK